LPWAIRIGNEDANREPLSQPLVLGHLIARLIGQRFPQRRRYVPKLLREALASTSRILSLQSCHEDQPRRPLQQGAARRAIASHLNQVAFSMTGLGIGRVPHWRRDVRPWVSC
jgi:hypothetical protein